MKKILLSLALLLFSTPAFALKIHFAKDLRTQKYVRPHEATKGHRFECTECRKELVLRQGNVLQPHFAHKSDPNGSCGGGGPETHEHLLAKQLIVEHLSKWHFTEKCSKCPRTTKTHRFTEEARFTAEEEYPIRLQGSDFVADVMILDQRQPFVAVEVHQTHAVPENKLSIFQGEGIPIFEIEAQEIIEAVDNNHFALSIREVRKCNACKERDEWKNRRPCLQCKKWYSKDLLTEVERPLGHKYPVAYSCDSCLDSCPGCDQPITQDQLAKSRKCNSCNRKKLVWERQAVEAITRRDIPRLKELLSHVPDEIEQVDYYFAKLEELEKAKKLELVLAKKKEEEHLIKQKELEERLAVEREQEKKHQEILRAAEEERNREQERQHRIELRRVAENIVKTDRLNLIVPYSDNHLIRRYSAVHVQGDNWYVKARHIEDCRQWIPYQQRDVIPVVVNLMKNNRLSGTKRKRLQEKNEKAAKGSKRITDFFGAKE